MKDNCTLRLLVVVVLASCSEPIEACTKKKYYKDLDGDGYGDPNNWTRRCKKPRNWEWTLKDKATDCNDASAGSNLGAVEVCDGIDNDCDGEIDEGVMTTFYADGDGDGFGDSNATVKACAAPFGFVNIGGDCEPQNAKVHPDAIEVRDGFDNNCNGKIDDM